MDPTLEDLLEASRARLESWLRREASGLLRYEEPDDLVQGVHLRAFEARATFEYQGDAAFTSWLWTLARRYVADRNDHWKALKRGAGRVLRLTASEKSEPTRSVPLPVRRATGPATFAARRELLVLAAKALDSLPERDQQLVRWRSEGRELEEQARELDLSYAAAQRASLRAWTRYESALRVLDATQGTRS